MSNVLRFAIFGHPVAHSLSPSMHAASFRALGLDATYEAFDVPPENLEGELKRVQAAGYRGLNITVPHKQAVMRYLTRLDVSAARYGAVNTVRFEPDGTSTGFNTDVIGFVEDLKSHGFSLAGKRVLLLGCGGAGAALATVCCYEHAAELVISNRTVAKAAALADHLNALALGTRVSATAFPPPSVREADLVVNATPFGLHPGDPPALPTSAFRLGQAVYDIVPTATVPPTAAAARAAGATAYDGTGFLVGQGAAAFRIWTGLEPDLAAMRAAVARR